MLKTILTTITATTIIIAFVVSIFINGVLGVFGLAKISLETLNGLQKSALLAEGLKAKNAKLKKDNSRYKKKNSKYRQKNSKLRANNTAHTQKINTIKERHRAKNLNISKKFAKRSSRKIASSTIAAATIGTAGVATVVAGLEVYDYCEDKAELLGDTNILFDRNEKFDYTKCWKDARNDSAKMMASIKKTASKEISNAWQNTKGFSKEKWGDTKAISGVVWRETKDFSKDQWGNVKTGSNDLLQKGHGTNEWIKSKWGRFSCYYFSKDC